MHITHTICTIQTYHTYQYKQYMQIHIDTYQNWPIPLNKYNTSHIYNTYKYISIHANTCTYQMSVHTNTYQYLQYIPNTIHTNTNHTTYHANTNTWWRIILICELNVVRVLPSYCQNGFNFLLIMTSNQSIIATKLTKDFCSNRFKSIRHGEYRSKIQTRNCRFF